MTPPPDDTGTGTVQPQVLLMDEPCSALDPISTAAIEELIAELRAEYTIVIVTHNMQRAARVSQEAAFFNLAGPRRPGRLVEMNPTSEEFSCRKYLAELDKEHRLGKYTLAELEEEEQSLDRLRRWYRDLRARDLLGTPSTSQADEHLKGCTAAFEEFAEAVYAAASTPSDVEH